MQTAVLSVVVMLITAPIAGYLRATILAAELGLVPKDALENETAAMSLH